MAVNGVVTQTTWTDLATNNKSVVITELRGALDRLQSLAPNVQNCNCANCTANCCQSQCSLSCQMNQCQCSDGCGNCCFAKGSLVLMADYSWKSIEDIVVGDQVIGIDGKANIVQDLHAVKLGSKRSMLRFSNGLTCSAEHLFWVKMADQEFFGTRDYNQYLREKAEYGCLRKSDPFVLAGPAQYATLGGWQLENPIIDRTFNDDDIIYSLVVDGSHTAIVHGYVTGVFVNDEDFDYTSVSAENIFVARQEERQC